MRVIKPWHNYHFYVNYCLNIREITGWASRGRCWKSCIRTRQGILEEKTYWSDKETDSLSLNRSIEREKMLLCLEREMHSLQKESESTSTSALFFSSDLPFPKYKWNATQINALHKIILCKIHVYRTSEQRLMPSSPKNGKLQNSCTISLQKWYDSFVRGNVQSLTVV